MIKFTPTEKKAVAIYAMASRDVSDFLESLEEADTEVVKLVWEMVSTTNPNMSDDDKKLNEFLVPFVKARLPS